MSRLTIRWEPVGRGAALSLVFAIPAIVGHEVIDAFADLDTDSNVTFALYIVVVAGLVVGGWRAGAQAPDAPLTHGALAALTAYVVIAVATTVVRVAVGDGADMVAVVFNALMAVGAGILGGIVAARRPRPAGSGADHPG
ncbi:MAG: TIGR04086 family membrane protein [Actinomycetota bacterium]|nr:TIGR04086 family membrane protein [Actinomycetota bacterium]